MDDYVKHLDRMPLSENAFAYSIETRWKTHFLVFAEISGEEAYLSLSLRDFSTQSLGTHRLKKDESLDDLVVRVLRDFDEQLYPM